MRYNPRIQDRKQYVLPQVATYKHKLDVVENQMSHHIDVIEAASLAAATDVHLYPRPTKTLASLMSKIAAYVGCNPDQIILTNGSDSALKLLCDSYIFDNVNVVIPTPSYPHFISFASQLTNNITYTDIDVKSTSMEICEQVSSAITPETNMVYLVSPNLPLGYVLRPEDIENMLIKYPHALIVIDEAYCEYRGISCSHLLKYTNFCIVRTFSKCFGLASLRIGYLVSNITNINYMKAIVNEKSVTETAIAAANAALSNLNHYLDNVKHVEDAKGYLESELSRICDPDSPIYGYNITGGNFYLIYAHDTKAVCRIFADHGVYVRDKHSDVKNSIRIAIGLDEQNRDVIDLIKYINLKSLLLKFKVVFDLDNTLRLHSKNIIAPYPGSKILEKCDSFICTNNTSYTPDEISKYFGDHNVNIASSRIYSPLTFAKSIISDKYSIIGSDNVVDYFGKSIPIELADTVYISNKHFLDESTIIKLCTYKPKLLCTIGGDKINLSNYADNDTISDVLIPDIGQTSNMLSQFMPVETIGKPNNILPFSGKNIIMVGDSDTDMDFARNIGALFIRVNGIETPRCEFDNCITVPDVDYLYDLIK
jgi:histidinol-phosphate aminotransferase